MNAWTAFLILGTLLLNGDQAKYFPESHQNVYIGMSADALLKARGKGLVKGVYFDGKKQFTETPPRDTVIVRTTYILDQNHRVFEVIIEYRDHFNLERYMTDLYGKPNFNGEEWVFKLENSRELYIWQYQNRLCIADGELYK